MHVVGSQTNDPGQKGQARSAACRELESARNKNRNQDDGRKTLVANSTKYGQHQSRSSHTSTCQVMIWEDLALS